MAYNITIKMLMKQIVILSNCQKNINQIIELIL